MPSHTTVHVWEHDPGNSTSPEGGKIIEAPVPDLTTTPFAVTMVADAAPPGRYDKGTPEFRFWAAAAAVGRMTSFWREIVPGGRWHPDIGDALPLVLDAGKRLNAFYDRNTLSFFHDTVEGKTVFSGESPDIVCHEAGHAALDALKPKLFEVASLEADAFHEFFGDAMAILSALQMPSLRAAVLEETGGEIFRSSRLSRLAEQLGWAIRKVSPDSVEEDCLRNAVNSRFYEPPEWLPPSGSASELTSEPHSFSRVFTAAFFRALAGMFAVRPARTEEELQAVSVDMARLLVEAVRTAPIVPEYYSQIGAHLVSAAKLRHPEYTDSIAGALQRHGILSPRGVALVARTPKPVGIAAFGSLPLPAQEIDVSQYGFTVPTITCVTASNPKTFAITGPARGIGETPATSPEAAARAYVESLIRRNRLDPKQFAARGIAASDPSTLKTHELVQDGEAVLLRRRCFDCIPRRPVVERTP